MNKSKPVTINCQDCTGPQLEGFGDSSGYFCVGEEMIAAAQSENARYESVKGLLYYMVYCHQRKCGGEIEELLSVANEYYVHARDKWDPAKAKFSTYVGFRVRLGLLDFYKNQYGRRSKNPHPASINQDIGDLMIASKQPSKFSELEWAQELSEQGEEAMLLALEAPISKTSRRAKRTWLRRQLDVLGWSYEEVEKTFEELRYLLWNRL